MDNARLRAIILNLQDRLSNDDRKRLHFYLGNDVPRRIRDDPTLGGTLNLMDSLFDQDKINEEDFSYLIEVFDQIRCFDAAKVLKEYLNRNRENILNQSVQSLSLIMSPLYEMHAEEVFPSKPKRKIMSTQRLLLFFLLCFGTVLVFVLWNQYEMNKIKNDSKMFMAMMQQTKANETEVILSRKQLQDFKKQINRLKIKIDKWNPNATTIAGGNKFGSELNQLFCPEAFVLDRNQNIFIADTLNDRIVKWKPNEKIGEIVAGGNGAGAGLDQLISPRYVIVDEQNHSLIISDGGNNRVIRWFNRNQQEILISNISCWGLAMDKYGYLYTCDSGKNEVRRWKIGENGEGKLVASGHGKENEYGSCHIFVDDEQSVCILDIRNDHVLKWRKDATEGVVVAGGNGRGNNLDQWDFARGIAVDDLGRIYIADSSNHRIMHWIEGEQKGEIIVGGNGKGNRSNQLDSPCGLSFDIEENFYVLDRYNQRVQRFDWIS